MTQFLPPNLLALFQARPPIPYLPPPDLKKRKLPAYQGVSSCLSAFEDPADTPPPQPPKPDTKESRKKRKREEKETANQQRITEQLESCTPPTHLILFFLNRENKGRH
jgi:U1 small nuclear ribonucleoprotein